MVQLRSKHKVKLENYRVWINFVLKKYYLHSIIYILAFLYHYNIIKWCHHYEIFIEKTDYWKIIEKNILIIAYHSARLNSFLQRRLGISLRCSIISVTLIHTSVTSNIDINISSPPIEKHFCFLFIKTNFWINLIIKILRWFSSYIFIGIFKFLILQSTFKNFKKNLKRVHSTEFQPETGMGRDGQFRVFFWHIQSS